MKIFVKIGAVLFASFSLLAYMASYASAQPYSTFYGPTASPPGNNPLGPVWLQSGTPTQQTGSFSIIGSGNISTYEVLGDNLFMTNGKSIRADLNSGSSSIYVSNYGTAPTGFTLNVRGNIRLDNAIAGTPGIIYVPQICLGPSGSEVCRTTWPGAVTDVWVNTTGDSMTGRLNVNATGMAIAATGTTIGVQGYGNTAGGYFRDTAGTSDAYLGYGNVGVQGTGSDAGGYFVDTDGSNAYVGSGGYGILGYGDTGGAFFSNLTTGAQATIGSGSYGITAYGKAGASGAYVTNLDVTGYAYLATDNASGFGTGGILARGATYGGRFEGPSGTNYATIGTSSYGVDARGSTAGGIFRDGDNPSGMYAVLGYGNYGVYASGTTGVYGMGRNIGGQFENSRGTGSARAALYGVGIDASGTQAGANLTGSGPASDGVYAVGVLAGGSFYDSNNDSFAHVASGDSGIYAQGENYGVHGEGSTAGGYFEDLDAGDSGYAYVGYGDIGVVGYGDGRGGYFVNSIKGSNAGLAQGTNGIIAEGNDPGNVNGGYGILANGGDAGGVFYNSKTPTTVTMLGYGNFSFWANDNQLFYNAGKAKIGGPVAEADTMLQVVGGSDASVSNRSGYFVIGDITDTNIVMDDNEIMGRNNGASSALHFQADGGSDVTMFNNVSGGQIRFQPTGRVGIGNTSPAAALHVQGAVDGTLFRLQDTDGTCNGNPESGSVTWTCSSDIKLKTNIRPLISGLDKVMLLKPSSYIVKASGERKVGFIAQDIQKVLPEIVSTVDEEGTLGVAQEGMIPYMVKAIQDLKRENDALRARIEKLEAVK
jgi:hypothetical protein